MVQRSILFNRCKVTFDTVNGNSRKWKYKCYKKQRKMSDNEKGFSSFIINQQKNKN